MKISISVICEMLKYLHHVLSDYFTKLITVKLWNFRIHNKGFYFKMGLQKMVKKRLVKDLHRHIRLEVDGRLVELPPVEGIIILNILRYISGIIIFSNKGFLITVLFYFEFVCLYMYSDAMFISTNIYTINRIAGLGATNAEIFSNLRFLRKFEFFSPNCATKWMFSQTQTHPQVFSQIWDFSQTCVPPTFSASPEE